MRASDPMPLRTISTFAPTRSQRLAISFMNEMRVASMALAAYLVISAEGMSMNSTRKLLIRNGRYRRVISARSLSMPTTTRSGDMKSLMAAPSFRNSGFEATSNGILQPRLSISSRITALTFCAVPTGTVLLVTSTVYFLMLRPNARATSSTYFRSAEPSSSGGVPTAEKTTSTLSRQSVNSVVKCRRPSSTLRLTSSSSPGS